MSHDSSDTQLHPSLPPSPNGHSKRGRSAPGLPLAATRGAGNPFLQGLVRGDALLTKVFPPRVWTIEHVLIQGKLAMLHGAEETNKSWILLDLAVSVAAGVPWVGRATTAGPVVLISYEMDELELRDRFIKQREVTLKAYPDRYETCAHNLYFMAEDSLEDGDLPQLLAENHERRLTAMVRHVGARLLLCDPLNQMHEGGDSDTKDVAPLLAVFNRLRRKTGCSIIVVHHNTKDGDGYRGNGRFGQDPRLRLEVTRDDRDNTRTLTFKKLSAGKKPEPVTFKELDGGEVQYVASALTGDLRKFYKALDLHPDKTNKALAILAGVNEGSVSRLRKQLLERGYVRSDGTVIHNLL